MGLISILGAQPAWHVVAEASDGNEAVARAVETSPCVAVLDHFMPGLTGLEATREIMRQRPNTRCLLYTNCDNDGLVRDAIRAGARGFVLKCDGTRTLIDAINTVSAGKPFLTPHASQALIKLALETASNKDVLTFREKQVVRLASMGYTNKQMALVMGISLKTVETHRAVVMRKLDVGSFACLVRYAVRNNLIEP